jgi:hypothetical protein
MDPTNDLVLARFVNHFPNLALFEDGRFAGLVSGHKSKEHFARFIEETWHAATSVPRADHVAELRAKLRETRKVAFDVETLERNVLADPDLGSYFRPLREREVLVFPRNDDGQLYLFDLKTKASSFVDTAGDDIEPYDVTGLPWSDSVVLIFSTGSSYSNALLDLAGPLAGGGVYRTVYHRPSGNIYPSGGLVEATSDRATYQVITNWGNTAMRELRFRKDREGLVFESETDDVGLCSGALVSTPHIAPRGRRLRDGRAGLQDRRQ